MEYPADLRYTKDHEWARASGDNVVVGITSFAVEQLGDITLVELPQAGATVTTGESLGTIESVKSVSEIYAPVSGRVIRVNEKLEDSPELVNESPFGEGWMVEIEPAEAALDNLLDAESYAELVRRSE
jgi:glycine cleavage system H protein